MPHVESKFGNDRWRVILTKLAIVTTSENLIVGTRGIGWEVNQYCHFYKSTVEIIELVSMYNFYNGDIGKHIDTRKEAHFEIFLCNFATNVSEQSYSLT